MDQELEQIALYRQRERQWASLQRLLERIHRANLHDTAVAVVNEARPFIGCDRVSVICGDGRRARLLAVSGVERIEPRSCVARHMRQLAAAVLKSNEPLWHIGESQPCAPQIEQPLQAYLDESPVRALAALPLQRRPPSGDGARTFDEDGGNETAPLGVFMLEWFAMPVFDELTRERIELVTRHAAIALAAALETERLPLIGVSRSLAKVRWLAESRQLSATLWVLGIVAALLVALVVVPADFDIEAEGDLQPAKRREIFAPADGVVDAVLVEQGVDVAAGQPLLRLRSSALDLENARLQGEIETAQKRLAAIRAARFDQSADKDDANHRYLQLTAEEEELKQSLHSMRQQEQLLGAQRAELEIRAPLAGRVLTWDVARWLAARPVERGQSLLSVGDVSGRWQADLRVPDHQIGYVLAAAEQARRDGVALSVSVLVAAEPGVVYEGEIERIALRSQLDDRRGEAAVLLTVRFNESIENPRPGAAVVGKIQCGRRSLGFVWLHDAWNSIRRRVLF